MTGLLLWVVVLVAFAWQLAGRERRERRLQDERDAREARQAAARPDRRA